MNYNQSKKYIYLIDSVIMDQNQELLDQLQSTVDKLIDIFGDEYQITYVESPQRVQNITHVTHVHHTYTYPWYYSWYYPWYYPDHHCCHKNEKTNKRKKEEDEEKEENQGSNGVAGMIIIGGVTLIGTILFATDGYVTLQRSQIGKNIEDISDTSQTIGKFNNVHDTIEKCQKWIKHYEQRTKPIFWSKVGLIASGLAFGIGMFTSNNNVKNAAIGGTLLSTCYLLWQKLSKSDSKNKESRLFNDAVSSINNARLALATPEYVAPVMPDHIGVSPSAPPHYMAFKQ